MKLRILQVFAAAILLATDAGHAQPTEGDRTNSCPAAGDAALKDLLVLVRDKYEVPAVAAAVVTSKGIEMQAVAGTRKRGSDVPATLDDLWHLGSETKAMTAALVAKLVEKGELRWESTVANVFPELAKSLDSTAREITLLHLLSHRSGLKPNPDLLRFGGTNGPAERLRVLKEELGQALAHKPGSRAEYSNLGYVVAGAMVERVTGKNWEEAMQEEIFRPLGMKSVGLGGTGTPGKLDQPWGHTADGAPVPTNGPEMDNPPVLSPAGRVHCTTQDWARFIADLLRGTGGAPALLKTESYTRIRNTPFGGDYALGWLAVDRAWGGGKVLTHAGDNTMNFANVWVAPNRDFAVLVCINRSGDKAAQASDDIISKIIQLRASK